MTEARDTYCGECGHDHAVGSPHVESVTLLNPLSQDEPLTVRARHPEFRCTRGDLYTHDCLGRDDLSVRQGHYIRAATREAAIVEMARQYPNDPPESFTADKFKE